MPSRLDNIYESGRTVRYHANPKMNHLQQTTADHTWGMIAMLFYLHPDPSPELIGYITFHDSEERWIGDIPWPGKALMPELIEQHEAVGRQICRQKGIPEFTITEEDRLWVQLLDRLESYQFARLHNQLGPDWEKNNEKIRQLAKQLGVEHKVKEVFDDQGGV